MARSTPHIRPQSTVDLSFVMTDLGISDQENADICGVAVKTIRRWRTLYREAGVPRGQTSPFVACPICDRRPLDDEAYAHLLGWYLGDGHLVRYKAKDVYSLRIYNDLKYPGLNAEIAETQLRVKGGGNVIRRTMQGCLETKVEWKHWICLFPQHGPGMKHTRPIVLDPWQRDIVARHPGRFLRGLFHSDGCRITNWATRKVAGETKRYEYPRYFFSNESRDIIDLCTWALDLLGIAWRRPRPNAVSVARREAVAELDRYVGPKH